MICDASLFFRQTRSQDVLMTGGTVIGRCSRRSTTRHGSASGMGPYVRPSTTVIAADHNTPVKSHTSVSATLISIGKQRCMTAVTAEALLPGQYVNISSVARERKGADGLAAAEHARLYLSSALMSN
uniref:Uncharacterized protein n=1 Tax=Plectus sambesii TaxID=2011161 RepID=A0A914XA27_9BILA